MKKEIFHWISIHRNGYLIKPFEKLIFFIGDAISNKNNNHIQNGEFELQRRLSNMLIRTVFDVGANTGDWTLRISKLMGNAQIFSFEPIPSTFQKLKEKLHNLPNIQLVDKGLSDRISEVKFFQFSDNSLFSSQFDRIEFQDKREVLVNLTTGVDFCNAHQIKVIDFLKIDVEGLEMAVLKGFEDMLNSGGIRVIQFEYGPMNIESRTFLKDFYDFLLPKGYLIGKLFPDGVEFNTYSYKMDDFKWANFVAVLRSEENLIKKISV